MNTSEIKALEGGKEEGAHHQKISGRVCGKWSSKGESESMYIKSSSITFLKPLPPNCDWKPINVILKDKGDVKEYIDSYINTVKSHILFFAMKFTTRCIL